MFFEESIVPLIGYQKISVRFRLCKDVNRIELKTKKTNKTVLGVRKPTLFVVRYSEIFDPNQLKEQKKTKSKKNHFVVCRGT